MPEDPLFLTVEEVVAIHEYGLSRYGGSPGLRDAGLLESAVYAPRQTMFGTYLNEDLAEMAASYWYSLSQNHAFVDGNKRTASQAAVVFLLRNGYQLVITADAIFELAESVGRGELDKKSLATTIRSAMSALD